MFSLKFIPLSAICALFLFVSSAHGFALTPPCENAAVDVTFVLTPSWQLGEHGFKEMIAFVRNVVQGFKLGGNYIRVNVISYVFEIKVEIRSNESQTFESVSSELSKIKYEEGSGEVTEILEYLNKNIHSKLLRARSNVPKVIIYITDLFYKVVEEDLKAAKSLQASKVTMFAIGVGKEIHMKSFLIIAGKVENRLYAKSFKDLTKETKFLPKRICEVDQCSSSPCRNGKVCKTKETSHECICPPGEDCSEKKPCVCTTSGDPHYRTFDGQMIHFMGICKYTLVSNGNKTDRKNPFFTVEVKNEHRHNSRVSYTRMVDVKLENVIVRLLPKHEVLVDSEMMSLPIYDHKQFIANYSSGWVNVFTEWGLHVKFDGVHRVIVTIHGANGGFTGICGDCNGKKDDLKTKDGKDVSNKRDKFAIIGESHKVNDDSDKPQNKCFVKDVNATCSNKVTKRCDFIRNQNIFGQCLKKLGETIVSGYYEACKIDACSYHQSKKEFHLVVCKSFEGFAEECEKLGITVNWRNKAGCDLNCENNEEYKFHTLTCQPTCGNLSPQCESYTEACVCKPDYVLSGTKCVKKEKCGCFYKGRYLQINETFYNKQCSKKITCESQDKIVQEEIPPCGPNSQCAVENRIRHCACNKGFVLINGKCIRKDACFLKPCQNGGTCSSNGTTFHCTCAPEYRGKTCSIHMRPCICKGHGDPHYQLFDGQGISFAGVCKYLMARPMSRLNLTDFQVEVKNEHRKNDQRISFTRFVEIKFMDFRVKLMGQRKVMVNSKEIKTPILTYPGFKITEKSGWLRLETIFGLRVQFNGNADFVIELSPIYRNHMTGICGNCNGVKDDYKTKSGIDVSSKPDKYATVVNSYQVFDDSLNSGHISLVLGNFIICNFSCKHGEYGSFATKFGYKLQNERILKQLDDYSIKKDNASI